MTSSPCDYLPLVSTAIMGLFWLLSEFLGFRNRKNGAPKSLLELLGRSIRVLPDPHAEHVTPAQPDLT